MTSTTSTDKKSGQGLVFGLIALIGLFLLIFKIIEDSEPGAIPLFLLLVGGIGGLRHYLLQRRHKKS
ncbi:hypothetical protein QWY31_00485 [Cytophagales bacterium LB-30]|uniref:Uncharacterized protein n=1 Tax=Shiella aurantiaca TaxID=3058365 RepID=A0ABT8F0K0_9BACT|nr:hypothetical protein [Shiella aurantiaca]MDN4163952.1 hypothetical protein [Shiella aurantiaca]